MKFGVSDPCQEDWDKMKIGLNSRFCDSCTKSVMDFTSMSREEIIDYLAANKDKKVCGRFNQSQLDYQFREALITIQRDYKKSPNRALYYLSLSALLCLSFPDTAFAQQNESLLKEHMEMLYADTSKFDSLMARPELPEVEIQCFTTTGLIEVEPVDTIVEDSIIFEEIIMGDVLEEPDDSLAIVEEMGEVELGVVDVIDEGCDHSNDSDEIYLIVEEMPEFPGGMPGIVSYLKEGISVIDSVALYDIQNVSIASMVIDSFGRVTKPRIVRSSKSKVLDEKFIELLLTMPLWVPGKQNGKAVNVQFSIPLRVEVIR